MRSRVDLHDAGGNRFSGDGAGDGHWRALVVCGREAAFIEFAGIKGQNFTDFEVEVRRDIRTLISFSVLPFGHVELACDPLMTTNRHFAATPRPVHAFEGRVSIYNRGV